MTDALMTEEWLAAPRKRSRGRLLLVALLAAAVCFLGGALVQKHFGPADTGSTAGPPSMGALQLPGNLPDLPQTGTTTDEGTSVIGEVVAVRDGFWIVRDLGGKRHRIAVTDDTDVVRERSIKATEVKVGDNVDISGSSVTLR